MRTFEPYGAQHAVVRRQPGGNVAFVTFATSEQAAAAVDLGRDPGVVLHKRKLRILRADTWHDEKLIQPNSSPAEPGPSKENDPFPGLIFKSIAAELPVDCIAKIATYLPYRDRARMECVSRRWREGSLLSHTLSTSVTMSLKSWHWIYSWELRPVPMEGLYWALQRTGPRVQKLLLDNVPTTVDLQPQIVTIAANTCTNLQVVDTSAIQVRPNALRIMSNLKLHTLKIGKTVGPIDCELGKIFGSSPNLKILDLDEPGVVGTCFETLGHCLETISLSYCRELKTRQLANAIKIQTSLHTLHIIGCTRLVAEILLPAIMENPNTLKELAIHILLMGPEIPVRTGRVAEVYEENTHNLNELPRALKSVKSLCLSHATWVTEDLIAELGEHVKDLHTLNLMGNRQLFDESALDPIGEMTTLKILNITGLTDAIGGSFLRGLVNLEELHCRDNQGIYDEDICELLVENDNLRLLDLEGCLNIGRDVVTCAYEQLRLSNKQHVLNLKVGGTNATPNRRDRRNRRLAIVYHRTSDRLIFD